MTDAARVHETGIMAGMSGAEINNFMDDAFRDVLKEMAGSEHFDKVLHLRWLSGHAVQYAESAGLFGRAMNRATDHG